MMKLCDLAGRRDVGSVTPVSVCGAASYGGNYLLVFIGHRPIKGVIALL